MDEQKAPTVPYGWAFVFLGVWPRFARIFFHRRAAEKRRSAEDIGELNYGLILLLDSEWGGEEKGKQVDCN